MTLFINFARLRQAYIMLSGEYNEQYFDWIVDSFAPRYY